MTKAMERHSVFSNVSANSQGTSGLRSNSSGVELSPRNLDRSAAVKDTAVNTPGLSLFTSPSHRSSNLSKGSHYQCPNTETTPIESSSTVGPWRDLVQPPPRECSGIDVDMDPLEITNNSSHGSSSQPFNNPATSRNSAPSVMDSRLTHALVSSSTGELQREHVASIDTTFPSKAQIPTTSSEMSTSKDLKQELTVCSPQNARRTMSLGSPSAVAGDRGGVVSSDAQLETCRESSILHSALNAEETLLQSLSARMDALEQTIARTEVRQVTMRKRVVDVLELVSECEERQANRDRSLAEMLEADTRRSAEVVRKQEQLAEAFGMRSSDDASHLWTIMAQVFYVLSLVISFLVDRPVTALRTWYERSSASTRLSDSRGRNQRQTWRTDGKRMSQEESEGSVFPHSNPPRKTLQAEGANVEAPTPNPTHASAEADMSRPGPSDGAVAMIEPKADVENSKSFRRRRRHQGKSLVEELDVSDARFGWDEARDGKEAKISSGGIPKTVAPPRDVTQIGGATRRTAGAKHAQGNASSAVVSGCEGGGEGRRGGHTLVVDIDGALARTSKVDESLTMTKDGVHRKDEVGDGGVDDGVDGCGGGDGAWVNERKVCGAEDGWRFAGVLSRSGADSREENKTGGIRNDNKADDEAGLGQIGRQPSWAAPDGGVGGISAALMHETSEDFWGHFESQPGRNPSR